MNAQMKMQVGVSVSDTSYTTVSSNSYIASTLQISISLFSCFIFILKITPSQVSQNNKYSHKVQMTQTCLHKSTKLHETRPKM